MSDQIETDTNTEEEVAEDILDSAATEHPLYKHVTVTPIMMEIGEWKTTKIKTGTKKIKRTQGVFNKKEVVVEKPIYETKRQWVTSGKRSDVQIDSEDFGLKIATACNELDNNGYDIVEMIPILRGNYQYQKDKGILQKGSGTIGQSISFGYSLTDAVTIIAKRRD